ncbi:MAG: hypothetical protein ACRC0A_01905 [Chitinophagaceae bacterium]
MNKFFLFSLFIISTLLIFAQEHSDQNPNYKRMIIKYSAIADSFSNMESTSLQRTYKAYDWNETKMQEKAERKAFNRELRLIEAKNSYYNYNYDYGYLFYSNYRNYNYPFSPYNYYPYSYGNYGNYYRNNWTQAIVPPLIGAAVGTAASVGMYHLLRK